MTSPFHGIARVQSLSPSDLDAWETLQATVARNMPGALVDFKRRDQLVGYFDGSLGRAYGVFERGQLIAGALMRVPTPERPLPGSGFPRVSASDWSQHTALLESAMVAPVARGRGHQRALLHARRAEARELGLRWLACGVRANNTVSLLNLINSGMALVGSRENADGSHALALLSSLNAGPLPTDVSDYRYVHREDQPALYRALLDGYIGVSLFLKDLIVCERAAPANPGT